MGSAGVGVEDFVAGLGGKSAESEAAGGPGGVLAAVSTPPGAPTRGHTPIGWPLRDYFSGRDAGDGMKIGCELSQRERIAFMQGLQGDVRATNPAAPGAGFYRGRVWLQPGAP